MEEKKTASVCKEMEKGDVNEKRTEPNWACKVDITVNSGYISLTCCVYDDGKWL